MKKKGKKGKTCCPLIRAHSNFRFRWDLMIIALTLYITFTLPLQIAFKPDFLYGNAYEFSEIAMDIIFIVDIIINFRTTILDSMMADEEITDHRTIALRYLRGRFIIDVLSSIPYDTLVRHRLQEGYNYQIVFKIVSLLKLTRLIRFTKIMNFLNTIHTARLFLKLFKLIFYLIVYLHLQACAWYYYTR